MVTGNDIPERFTGTLSLNRPKHRGPMDGHPVATSVNEAAGVELDPRPCAGGCCGSCAGCPKARDYQEQAATTAVFPRRVAMEYLALGLCSEAGEVAGIVKKWLRKDGELDHEAIALELGDVMWYIANLAAECGFTMDEIEEFNLDKLFDRAERGVLKGSGDRR